MQDDHEARFMQALHRTDPPFWQITLRPHRSLSNRGFALIFLVTAGALAVPLLALLGTVALWGLLPFATLAFWMLWSAMRRNDLDGTLREHLFLWPDLIAVHRHNPRAPDQYWCANPYWVRPRLKSTREVQDYLTLRGAGREIELGRFLPAEDRRQLFDDLNRRLGELGAARHGARI